MGSGGIEERHSPPSTQGGEGEEREESRGLSRPQNFLSLSAQLFSFLSLFKSPHGDKSHRFRTRGGGKKITYCLNAFPGTGTNSN